MNKKKIKKLLILLVLIITIVGVGSLIAFLTDTDQETNVFTIGSIKIELTETNWNPNSGLNVLPGQPISKNPAINNIGNNPAYVYIKVVNPIVELTTEEGEGTLFSYAINSGWTVLDEVEQCGYKATTYYYDTSLNPNASTTTLFDTVTVNDFSENADIDQLLDVYAYGIQSTYLQSGSTIESLFSDTFKSDLSDTNGLCPTAFDCDNNPMITTMPTNLNGLAKIMAKNAYLDNGKSEFVNSCSGMDFSNISSDTNGKGIYEIASTKDDTYPIYYYRGAVDNNNVKFAGFCWKVIRTTDSGGVKMIYNGAPDESGNCTNTTGTSTQIGTGFFNSLQGLKRVGYMYSDTTSAFGQKSFSDLNTSYVYGNDVTYSNGTYTLQNTMTTTGTWSSDFRTLNNNHYTCFSTENTCTSVYFIYQTSDYAAFYITLGSGKEVGEALDEMFLNTTNSTIKTAIDSWYNTNLSSYTDYIEDTIYCNDRSIGTISGWNPNGGSITSSMSFAARDRAFKTYEPTLECARLLDRFTVSSSKGNGVLTYPVGLITDDEMMYAGAKQSSSNNTYYLYNNQVYWSMSPNYFSYDYAYETCITSSGMKSSCGILSAQGYRPVISLKSTDVVESGDGTSTNPYVIKTN